MKMGAGGAAGSCGPVHLVSAAGSIQAPPACQWVGAGSAACHGSEPSRRDAFGGGDSAARMAGRVGTECVISPTEGRPLGRAFRPAPGAPWDSGAVRCATGRCLVPWLREAAREKIIGCPGLGHRRRHRILVHQSEVLSCRCSPGARRCRRCDHPGTANARIACARSRRPWRAQRTFRPG